MTTVLDASVVIAASSPTDVHHTAVLGTGHALGVDAVLTTDLARDGCLRLTRVVG